MVQFIRSDLDFILQQILYAEQLTSLTAPDGSLSSADILSVLPNVQVPWGLRTVDGSFNNLVINETLGIDQTLGRLDVRVVRAERVQGGEEPSAP